MHQIPDSTTPDPTESPDSDLDSAQITWEDNPKITHHWKQPGKISQMCGGSCKMMTPGHSRDMLIGLSAKMS